MKCPNCGSNDIETERRPDGNSNCLDCGLKGKTGNFSVKTDVVVGSVEYVEFKISIPKDNIDYLVDLGEECFTSFTDLINEAVDKYITGIKAEKEKLNSPRAGCKKTCQGFRHSKECPNYRGLR